jgi:hypothetical protein
MGRRAKIGNGNLAVGPKLQYDPISNETHCSKCGEVIMTGHPSEQSDKDQERWSKHLAFHGVVEVR